MSHFRAYLAERFPVGPYLVLVGAMVLGAVAAACDGQGASLALGWRQAAAFGIVFLAFFHLRVFDEHKDYAKDLLAHPDRVLSRGLVTLADLRRAGAVAIALQLALGAACGLPTLLWTAAALAFSVAMRFEFGVGTWLNRHIVWYALTHNPIVALLMLAVVAATLGHAAATVPVIAYVVLASVTGLAFEVGRKLRAAEDEREGQDTYTAALGIRRAVALLLAVLVLSEAAGLWLLQATWARGVLAALGLLALAAPLRFARSGAARDAKAAEGTTTLLALGAYVLVIADVALRRGIAWG